MANENDHLVVGYFVNRGAAEATVEDLKKWDKANDTIKLGAIAVLTLDESTGKVQAQEMGQRDTKKGAFWGAGIGVVAGILTAGIGLIPGVLLGSAAGSGMGALNHKSVGMTDEDRVVMANRLKHGGAAVAVMADDFEVEATEAELERLGGTVYRFTIPEETASMVDRAVEVQTDAVQAIDDAVSSASDEVAEATRAVREFAGNLGADAAAAAGAVAAATGLTAAQAAKLGESGVDSVKSLLAMGATPAGRAQLASDLDMDGADVLQAVKHLDLMRVKGVGVKYANLLLASGVDTVVELGTRNATNLTAKMGEVNAIAGIVQDLPSEKMVADWVAAAKDLPRVIEY